MLKQLQIQNYAIIEKIVINFSGGFTTITGETGAGKSILMGALALILGERADTTVLLNRDKKSVVEGLFHGVPNAAVSEFLHQHDLDESGELVIRREIGPNGKSRAFVNDTPVNLDQLRTLSSLLVDLHQQFDNLSVGESAFQRTVLDALAGQVRLTEEFRQAFQHYHAVSRALAAMVDQKTAFNKEMDYHQFLLQELNEASVKDGELEGLEAELKVLNHAEEIKAALTSVFAALKEGDRPVVQRLKTYVHQLEAFAPYLNKLPAIVERMQSVQIELQDITEEIDSLNGGITYDVQAIELFNERLAQGYKLLKKHGLQSSRQLLDLQLQLEKKVGDVYEIDQQILAHQALADRLRATCLDLAQSISDNRHAQLVKLENSVNQLLEQVGMPNARLRARIQPVALHEFGIDHVEFLFDANKSNRFEPVSKVASGGELSRLMLCIKSLVAQSIDLPTMVFDEIDTGISGEAAKQVGIILQTLSANRQVIAITHQPQIAGRAGEHFLVYKAMEADAVKANIKKLSREERITSLAEMLSGAKPTAAALANAREMMAS